MNPSQLIAALNALTFGDLERLRSKLAEAADACRGIGQDDLAARLDEAGSALGSGDVKTYRRQVETVISRLGHLR